MTSTPERRRPSRLAQTWLAHAAVPLLVVGIVLAAAAAAGVGAARLIDRQNRELVAQRLAQIADELTNSLGNSQIALGGFGVAVADSGPKSASAAAMAANILSPGISLALLSRTGGAYRYLYATGAEKASGMLTDPTLAAVLDRALLAHDPLAVDVITRNGKLELVAATKVPGASGSTVVVEEEQLDPATPQPAPDGTAYSELHMQLFDTSGQPEPILAVTSGGTPKGQIVRRRGVEIGDEKWTLVASAVRPLTGTSAVAVGWGVFGAGVVLATLLGGFVSVLARRRAYALRLVEERTESLAASRREADRARADSERANAAKSEFLSRMSHELRTPLNAVLGFGQLLEMSELDQQQSKAVEQILHGGRLLLELINEVLDVSRVETGTLALSPEPVMVSELVGEVVDLVRPLADDAAIQLIADRLAEGSECVRADRQRIKQILLNLLSNAIKYNRPHGSVNVSCRQVGPDRLQIRVTDTGPGIPEDKLENVFVPFERLGAEHTAVEGAGIGLALSKRLAEAMGCDLGFESTLGRGSTFWLECPIVDQPSARPARQQTHTSRPGVPDDEDAVAARANDAREQAVVLYVEDNLVNIELVQAVLRGRPQVRLVTSTHGKPAPALARAHHPALILLDLNLTDTSGEDVMLELRSDPQTASIPVAVLSADAMPSRIKKVMHAGATQYLTKPIDVSRLLQVVDDALLASAGQAVALGGPAT